MDVAQHTHAVDEPFHQIFGKLDYPMFIVTASADGERAGCLVGFTTQCSISPVRFLVCLSKNNHTHGVAQQANVLGIHVVPENEEELARLFGEQTGDDVDKFARCASEEGPLGAPLLAACRDRFEARIIARLDVGDHTAFVLEPHAGRSDGHSFLGFQDAKDFIPGHEA